MKWQEKDQDQLKIYDVIKSKDVVHDTKNNMNMTSVHEYVKIIWINTNVLKFILYFKHNMTQKTRIQYKLTGLDMILYVIEIS